MATNIKWENSAVDSIFQRTEHIQYDHTSSYVKLCQHTTSEKPEFNLNSYITEVIFYLNFSRDFSDKRNDKKFDSDPAQSYLMIRVYKYKTFTMRKF